ncbi:hypothetical protein VTK26DRAFT_2147 [Humicola hyalothermophila]
MSQPVGRILRSAARRASAARTFGAPTAPAPAGSTTTTPAGLRIRPASAAGFHSAPVARRAQHNDGDNGKADKRAQSPTAEEGKKKRPDEDDGIAAAAGRYARTDESITVQYPAEGQLPSSKPVVGAGRAGAHVFPTLASFSLEGKVGVVTGGARGLGLVMGQGMVISGADLAIVDVNKEEAARQAKLIVETFRKENPDAKKLPKVTAHYADVSDPASVEACVAEIVAEHGRIDNLVTSAGFTENFEAVAYPVDRMRKLWGVNVDGTYLFATAVARHLIPN